MTDVHLFNNISLGGRGGTNPGQLKIYSGGILWKKQGGGKAVEVDKSEILSVTWTKVPRTNQLGVRIKDGLYYKFTGFRDQDVASLTSFFQNNCGITPEEKHLSVSGRNWGEVDLSGLKSPIFFYAGNMLTFLTGAKQAFEVSLADMSQTQLQGKNDVILEFHVDDTTGANEVFREKIISVTDVGAGVEEAVITFMGIAILTLRVRYSVELHLSFLRLQGQANDFKIQYSSVVRLFLLPKSNQPHTFVVVTLDPPICKGQTLYPHIVLQGLIHEVFTTIMRGLSGAKVTKPGKFRSCQDGYAVKSSLKAEDGVLYSLEKSFFFLPKPPTLILHEEIDYVEFERHAAGGSNMHYFDLLIRIKTEQEHLFRNIQRNEYHNLFDFIRSGFNVLHSMNNLVPFGNGVAEILQMMMMMLLTHILNALRMQLVEMKVMRRTKYLLTSHTEHPITRSLPTKKNAKDGVDDGKKKEGKRRIRMHPRGLCPVSCSSVKLKGRWNLKKSNPGASFTEVSRILGEKWKKLSEEEKEPYEAKAKLDRKRYDVERNAYKNPQPMNIDSGNESDSS
ncbi:FACT complex subunit SSRP1 [Hibiscus syriacus]|uniref:FACT complex subunit SSRP1 n=1 Tax=Hibiscus syriacus TaxID=106335 RepID=A0A6A2XFW8_HIBSY|nr:FACT complex subunit SSRP1 [Hibiscus syriacus]